MVAIALTVWNSIETAQPKPQFNVTFQFDKNTYSRVTDYQGAHIEYVCVVNFSLTNDVTLRNVRIAQWHNGMIRGPPPPNTALGRSYYSYEKTLHQFSSWNGDEFSVNATSKQYGSVYNPRCSITLYWEGGEQEFVGYP